MLLKDTTGQDVIGLRRRGGGDLMEYVGVYFNSLIATPFFKIEYEIEGFKV